MRFLKKAKLKQEAYTIAGYDVSDITEELDHAIFYSIKDGVKRKHTFETNKVSIDIIEEPKIEKVEPVVEKPLTEGKMKTSGGAVDKEESTVEPIEPPPAPKPKKKVTRKRRSKKKAATKKQVTIEEKELDND